MELLEASEVNSDYVILKFEIQPKVSYITNEHFVVMTTDATPVEITDPFEDIDLTQDYNSIARRLALAWKADLEPETTYTLTVTGIRDPTGKLWDDVVIQFTTDDGFEGPVIPVPEPEPVTVIDFSIVPSAFDDYVIPSAYRVLSVEETYPDNGDYSLPADFNYGRIIIKFSERPSTEYVNSAYFRVQKKEITRAPARWENIEAVISLDSEYPWVYVDLPSVDHYPEAATPSTAVVYVTDSHEYYSENYKYRVIVSKRVTS